MTVMTPNVYPIQFEEEDINAIKDAIVVLNEIIKAMKDNKCNVLEGGYVDSPTQYNYDDFVNINRLLECFVEDVPYNMYFDKF